MAFMALFGWIFIPIILLGLLFQAIAAPFVWAIAHPGAVNVIAAGVLAFNLLLFFLLLRTRKRRRRAGEKPGFVLLLAVLWEAWVVFLCALYLIVQPLRYLPAGFGEPFTLENNCYGTWTVVSCQGTTPGCTQSQEEINAFLGKQVAYSEDRFVSTDWTYALEDEDNYQTGTVRRESFPPLYSMKLESLGIDKRSLRYIEIVLPEWAEHDHPLGRELYILDKNTLLLYRRGVFFRAERAEDPTPSRPDRPIPPKIRDPEAAPYFADWTITELLGTDPKNPMDAEMIEKLLGTVLTYEAGYVIFERDDFARGTAEDAVYKEAELTPEEFQAAYGVSLEDLGVEPDTYFSVAIDMDYSGSLAGNIPVFQSLGNRFLLLDEDTMLLCCKGAFFRAELVPDSRPMIFDPSFELPATSGNS